jgi:hypothetical protein
MSLEINRRDFLKVVFTTTSAAAVSGVLPHWPAEALSRPIMEPVEFADDGYGYLIDPDMKYYDISHPTFREWLGLEGWHCHVNWQKAHKTHNVTSMPQHLRFPTGQMPRCDIS